MNHLDSIQSRLAIRQARQTITTEKEAMKNNVSFTLEEREIIKKNKGQIRPVLELRKARSEAKKAAPPVAASPVTPPAKGSATPPAATAPKATPAPAPSSTARPLTGLAAATAIHKQKAAVAKPATAPTAPKSTAPAPSSSAPLHGLQKAIAAARGEKVSHDPPAEPTGLQRAIAAAKAEKTAKAASKGK